MGKREAKPDASTSIITDRFTRDYTAYDPGEFDCIPLHEPDATLTLQKRNRKTGEIEFVVAPRGKRPIDKDWTKKKYDSANVQKRCIRERRNMGLRPKSKHVYFDIDPRHDGDASWEAIKRRAGKEGFDETEYPAVNTGGGGTHFYMLKPDNVGLELTLSEYPGVECRTSKHQVLAAGCRHPDSGKLYTFRKGHPGPNEMKMAPAWLIELFTKKPRPESFGGGDVKPSRLKKALAALDPTKFGTNDKWWPILCSVHHASGGSDEGRALFLNWSLADPAFADMEKDISDRWDSLKPDKDGAITVATLNKALHDVGRGSLAIPIKSARAAFADNLTSQADGDDDEAWGAEFDPPAEDTRALIVSNIFSKVGLRVTDSGVAAAEYSNAIVALRRGGMGFRWNQMSLEAEWVNDMPAIGAKCGEPLTDEHVDQIRFYLAAHYHAEGVSFNPTKDNIYDAAHMVGLFNKYHPVLAYLDSLEWDGVPRVGKLFGSYFNCGVDDYTRGVSVAWMVGAVRRIKQPGCKFDTVPVMKGGQGIGKSSGFRLLVGSDWFSDDELDIHNKDAVMNLRRIWVHEFAELRGMAKREVESAKNFLSKQFDIQRDPYMRKSRRYPRHFLFGASTNEGGYLLDQTGNRRYWPLHAKGEIDLKRIARSRDQLWAEAAFMEAFGESNELDKAQWSEADKRRAAETPVDPWADELRAFLHNRARDKVDLLPADRVHSSELYDALGVSTDTRNQAIQKRLNSIMENNLGWTWKRDLKIRGYGSSGYVKQTSGRTVG